MSCMLTNMINLGVLSMPDHKSSTPLSDRQTVEDPAPATVPFVSSRLDIELVPVDSNNQADLTIRGIIFRQLDPDYFAWLRSRIVNAQKTHKAGKLTGELWESLKGKFLQVHEHALKQFGEEALKEAIRTFSQAGYQPPSDAPVTFSDWLYPAKGGWNSSQPVTSQALAKVDAIKNEALAKGWFEASLYQNRGQYKFPCGQEYGLVCHMEGNRRIGIITEQAIEIISEGKTGQQSVMRFYNPDVPQPWIRTTVKEACA